MSIDRAGVDPETGRRAWSAENALPYRDVRPLVPDLSAAEGQAEDAGIIREDMTDAQRAESLAETVHDMIAQRRALTDQLDATRRELREILAAQSPVQEIASYTFADMIERGGELIATVHALEAAGHQPGVRWMKEQGKCIGFTIGVRVAA